MKRLNYYISLYKLINDEPYIYDHIGYLQKDGEIGHKSIYATNKSMGEQLVKTLDQKGVYAVLKNINDEDDEIIKSELIELMNRRV